MLVFKIIVDVNNFLALQKRCHLPPNGPSTLVEDPAPPIYHDFLRFVVDGKLFFIPYTIGGEGGMAPYSRKILKIFFNIYA
jgi:hypothetical protein